MVRIKTAAIARVPNTTRDRVDESALKTFLLDGYSRDVAPDYPISANLSFYVKSIEKMDIVHSMGKFNLI